jgi:peptidoglycan/xylan/chitin deacetylase (PgdA/CDA1 family)
MPNYRFDRLLTLYFFYPLTQIIRRSKDVMMPILMYHSISDDPEEWVHPYYRISTPLSVFAEHMRYLHENHYTVIGLKNIYDILNIQNNLPNKNVVITFDDGYRDFYTNAYPILQKHNFTATVFLPTSFIGNEDTKLRGKEHLNWDEVKVLSKAGITFGSHSVTHPQLSALKIEDVDCEIKLSKEIIEDKLGERIDTFSYPFKFPEENWKFKKILIDLLQKYGYICGVSTRIGTTSNKDNRYFMKRIPINSGDDISFFQTKLERGYDWVHGLQYIVKVSKAAIPFFSRVRGY